MYEKLKSWLADDASFYAVLLVLVGVVSFGLGRQSVTSTMMVGSEQPARVSLQQSFSPPVPVTEESNTPVAQQLVVASKSGSKYHLPDCPSASQIKADNKIEFASAQQAEAAGYTPAANCPGLAH